MNYDLLLYWVTNPHPSDGAELPRRDGFEWLTEMGPYDELIWKERPNAGAPQIFYLHGALHLYEPGTGKLCKIKSEKTDPIISQVRSRIESGSYPHIVTEGSRRQKVGRIKASDYLRDGHEKFGLLDGTLFVHGMALSPNGGHIIELLERRDSRIHTVYVSVYGDPEGAENVELMEAAKQLRTRRTKNHGASIYVKFYSSESAHVWR